MKWIREGYRVRLEHCPDLAQIAPPVLKTAMHVEGDAARYAARIREQFPGQANIVAAGPKWVDVVANGADKGSALKRIQERFNILPEETAAFGDNENDIGMLKLAGHSYAVENAREQVKAAAGEVIGPMKDDAVLKVIRQFL
jgi:hydroxymethylpyrimidine pyrophosphatase-like HAD family hydrolase